MLSDIFYQLPARQCTCLIDSACEPGYCSEYETLLWKRFHEEVYALWTRKILQSHSTEDAILNDAHA